MKVKLDIKKFIPFMLFFIILLAISSVVMMYLKQGIEKNLKQYYSARIEEIKNKHSEQERSEKAANEQRRTQEAVRTLKEFSPEEIRKYQKELRQRIQLYDKKVAMLSKKEKELDAVEADVENCKKEMISMRKGIDDALVMISKERLDLDNDIIIFDESEKKNMKRLADIYASMEASKAAEILSKLNYDTSAKVLTGMPSRKSAMILAEIELSGAAGISEKMKRLQMTNEKSDETIKERNIRKLASIYQIMETEKAVSIIKELEDETAVNILSKMDEKKLAGILEIIEAGEASRLTEEIRKIMKKEFQNKEKIEGA